MGEVVFLQKWRAWRDLKDAVKSGRMYFPKPPEIRVNGNLGVALAYALAGAREAIWSAKHGPKP